MYTKHFGFSEKPFELSPNHKFFFLTPGYQATLEALLAGIKDRKGWMVLSGEVGTGKTMMIYGLLERIPEKVKTAFIFHATYQFGELLQQILSEVGEKVASGNLKKNKIQWTAYLEKLRERGEVLAVLIDEAQKLSPEIIQELLSLLNEKPWTADHLQLVLVGQPELDETLNTLLLKYRPPKPGLRLTIFPLSLREAEDYIEHRLRIVGSSSARIFTPDALSVVIEYGRGIPRVINILCDNAFLAGYSEDLPKIGIKTIWSVLENLEGPGAKIKKRFKARAGGHPPGRPRWAVWLVVVCVILVAAGLWWLPGGVQERLGPFKGWLAARVPAGQPEPEVAATKPAPGIPEQAGNSGEVLNPPAGADEAALPLPGRRIQVKKGDSLSKISLNRYGFFNESLIDLIMYYNPSVKKADLILENQGVTLPEIREETLVSANPDRTFRIILGTFADPTPGLLFKREPSLAGKNVALQARKGSGNRTWTRVEAGDFSSREEALAALKALRAKKLLPFF
ncbi:MAG: AAA family ATPase [Deltaproteobacteria bacterium]|nr:AAA family ATPase [Deltaproteobacteria bacterium]